MKKKNKRAMVAYYSSILFNTFRNINMAHFIPLDNKIQKLVVGIDPVQNFNGYDAPWPEGGSNNKFDTYTASQTQASNQGLDWTLENNVFSYSGTNSSQYCSVALSSLGLSSLTLPAGSWKLFIFNSSGVFIPRLTNDAFSKYLTSATTLVLTEEETFTRIVSSSLGESQQISGSFNIMVCDATQTEPESYFPYSNICPITGHSSVNVIVSTSTNPLDGTITNISLGQTVYGGTLDVVRGVLNINKRYISFSGDAALYGNYGIDNAPLYYLDIPSGDPIKRAAFSTDDYPLKSNYFRYITALSDVGMGDCEIRTRGTPTPDRLYFRWDSAADVTAINTAFSNTPLQVVAELVTPIEVSLTPMQINTIVGSWNYVWCDTGKIIEIEA